MHPSHPSVHRLVTTSPLPPLRSPYSAGWRSGYPRRPQTRFTHPLPAAAPSVIAWRVGRNGAEPEPIVAGGRPDGEMYLHLANGALIGGGELYPDLQHAVDAVLAAAAPIDEEEAA